MNLTASGPDMTRAPRPVSDILERLAAAMGTTGATFFGTDGPADAAVPSAVVAAQESVDLIKAFNEISEPEERHRCLAYVQAAAAVSKGKRL